MQGWTSTEWAAILTVLGAQIVAIIAAWRNGAKIERHEVKAAARARAREKRE